MPFFSARPTAIFNIRGRGRLPFLVRQLITTGYVAAGYKDSVPWRNVNSMNHSTDTTTNHGDIIQETANYTSGAHNRDNAFIWGTGGVGAFTSTSCFNMRNNTTLTKTTSMNTTYTVGDSATVQDHDGYGITRFSWQNANQGAAFIQKFNLTTEVNAGNISTTFDQTGTGGGSHFSEFWGYWWRDGGGTRRFTFTTETESTSGVPAAGMHGQQKGFSSKINYGWAGNEGSYNGGYLLRKTSYVTETLVSSSIGRPITNIGEENFDMGQDHNYMLGMYNGLQTNRSWRYTYATDSGFELPASGQPTAPGIAGRSSGHGYWRD